MVLFEVMFCRMCGKQIDDDAKFCPECGASQAETPVVDFTLNTSSSQPVKKNNKKLLAVLIPVIAVILVAAIACAAILPGLFAAKYDPKTVLANAVSGFGSRVGALVADYLVAYEEMPAVTQMAAKGTMEVELSQTLLDILSVSGEDYSWLSKIRMDYVSATEDDNAQVDASIFLSDQYIFGMELSYDQENGKMWIGLPDLQDELLLMHADTGLGETQTVVVPYQQLVALLAEERETIAEVIEKFIDARLSYLTAERIEETTVTVGQTDYTVNAVYCYAGAQLVKEKGEEFLVWLRDNDDFCRFVDRLDECISQSAGTEKLGLVDAMLEGIQVADDLLEENYDPEDRTDYCVYLNSAGQAIGACMTKDGADTLDFIVITEGNKTVGRVATAEFGVLFELTEKSGAISGKITIKTYDDETLTIGLRDLRIGQDIYGGTISMVLPRELVAEFTGNDSFAPKVELKVTMDGNREEAKFAFEILAADMPMATLSVDAELLDSYTIVFPEGGVDASDPEAAELWALNLDYTQLVDNLLKAGVPESVLMAMLYGVVGQ